MREGTTQQRNSGLKLNGLWWVFLQRKEQLFDMARKVPNVDVELAREQAGFKARREVETLYAQGMTPGQILDSVCGYAKGDEAAAVAAAAAETASTKAAWDALLEAVGDRQATGGEDFQWVRQHMRDKPGLLAVEDVPSRAAIHDLMWCQESASNEREFKLRGGRGKGLGGDGDNGRGRVKSNTSDTQVLQDFLREMGAEVVTVQVVPETSDG